MADKNKKILVIEDDVFLSQLFASRLEKIGVNTLKAANGEEGLKVMREQTPDLVLLDLILPGKKDGFDVLKDIREDPALQGIPVIVTSNLGQPEDVARGKKLGAMEYYVKAKTSIDSLMDRVQLLVNKKSSS